MSDPVLELIRKRFSLRGEEVLRDGKPIARKALRTTPYHQVCIGLVAGKKVVWRLHRVKFFLAHGHLPSRVDHRDGNKADNALDNLRAANPRQNGWNCKSPERDLPRGVRRAASGRFKAYLHVERKQVYLGTFDTPEEASSVVRLKSKELRGDFHRYRRKLPCR